MTNRDLIFVAEDGTLDTCRYNRAPSPTTMRADSADCERLAIQKIGERYEVYDLRTLSRASGIWTIGTPLAVLDDEDAAIMFAVMTVGKIDGQY